LCMNEASVASHSCTTWIWLG